MFIEALQRAVMLAAERQPLEDSFDAGYAYDGVCETIKLQSK
jgi:hypothetical protein